MSTQCVFHSLSNNLLFPQRRKHFQPEIMSTLTISIWQKGHFLNLAGKTGVFLHKTLLLALLETSSQSARCCLRLNFCLSTIWPGEQQPCLSHTSWRSVEGLLIKLTTATCKYHLHILSAVLLIQRPQDLSQKTLSLACLSDSEIKFSAQIWRKQQQTFLGRRLELGPGRRCGQAAVDGW